mmetsp:Transcript_28907/g.74181  ORF Transcript_28907/g.74181 Transcript_28907/m.74181 type:complete len:106 (+) Transcript_28907:2017-2334(+)
MYTWKRSEDGKQNNDTFHLDLFQVLSLRLLCRCPFHFKPPFFIVWLLSNTYGDDDERRVHKCTQKEGPVILTLHFPTQPKSILHTCKIEDTAAVMIRSCYCTYSS